MNQDEIAHTIRTKISPNLNVETAPTTLGVQTSPDSGNMEIPLSDQTQIIQDPKAVAEKEMQALTKETLETGVQIPVGGQAGTFTRGASQATAGLVSSITSPEGVGVVEAQMIPGVRTVVDTALLAAGMKQAAQDAAEWWVTGNKEKLGSASVMAALTGLGTLFQTRAALRDAKVLEQTQPARVASEQAGSMEPPAEPVASSAKGLEVAASGPAPAISEPTPKGVETQPGEEIPSGEAEPSAGPGAASPSDFPQKPRPIDTATAKAMEPLQKVRDAARAIWVNRDAREAATFTRDAADNAAKLFSVQQTSEITGPLRRTFGKDQPLADEALTFAVESGGTQEGLDLARAKIIQSNKADLEWKLKAIDAIDYAKYHLDELQPVIQDYNRITQSEIAAEHNAGVDTLERANYVMHAQDIEGDAGLLSTFGGGEATGFRKVRTHDTYADSIAAGVSPKTLSASELLQARLANGQNLINRRAWTEGLKSLETGKGEPMGADPVIVTRADGSTYPAAPPGYSLEYAGNQPIAIRQGMEGVFHALTDPSSWSRTAPGRIARNVTQGGKSFALMFDTFHLGRISVWDSLIKGLGIRTFEAPVPEWVKGSRAITLLDTSTRELNRMADAGEIPREWLSNLTEAKRQQDLAVKTGFNIGRISDSLHSELVDLIKPVGSFKQWLFQKYQRAAMMEAWRIEFNRRRMGRPEEPEAESARYVSKVLNTRFGNLGRQGLFRSRTSQDTARFLALAPQWNEGLIRSELGAVKEAGQFALDTAKGERIYAGLLMRSVGAMALMQFAANQIINYATRGHPTWDNPEKGIGAKLSAWVPDLVGKGPGFFLHPFGLAAETTHLLTKAYERSPDLRDALMSYLRSRVSTTMRPVMTFITNSDFLGRTLKPGTVWGEMAKAAVPVPIGGGAAFQVAKSVVTGKREEAYPGQFQKQAMASVGIKTDQAPSSEGRIQALAREFNTKKGIEPKAEFFAGDYSKLVGAVRVGNQSEAQAQLEQLRKTKTDAAIVKHFREWPRFPFTGQKKREVEFVHNLTEEEQQQYFKARSDRYQTAVKVREMLLKNPRKP